MVKLWKHIQPGSAYISGNLNSLQCEDFSLSTGGNLQFCNHQTELAHSGLEYKQQLFTSDKCLVERFVAGRQGFSLSLRQSSCRLYVSHHSKPDMWVCLVNLPLLCGRLYHTTHPLDDKEFQEKQSQLRPFSKVLDRNFTHKSDATVGSWHNYFIGIVGDVASVEHEVLWPNRVSLTTCCLQSAFFLCMQQNL